MSKAPKQVTCKWCDDLASAHKIQAHWRKACRSAPTLAGGQRICSACQLVRERTLFADRVLRLSYLCTICNNKASAEWRANGGEANAGRVKRLRPGAWKLRPCKYCGEAFSARVVHQHQPRCHLRPAVVAGPKPKPSKAERVQRMLQMRAESAANRPRREKGNALRSKYGITIDDYDRLMGEQDGKCAICRRPPLGKHARDRCLHIDHDHATGKVRGLLCYGCNLGLGKNCDNQALLIAALAYLADHCPVDVVA